MVKNCIGLDVETSKIPNHFPWRKGFYLSLISISYPDDTFKSWVFYHKSQQFYDPDVQFKQIQAEIDKYDVVAAHNTKFELNILRQHLKFKEIHCSMVGEYLINMHDKRDLNLNAVGLKYGLPVKDDRVKKMWDSGIDTYDIPISILQPYCEDDARKARVIYEKQIHTIYNKGLWKVFQLQMRWLDMLSYMESRGVGWDNNKAQSIVNKYNKYACILDSKIKKLTSEITDGHDLNLSSNDDLSVLLYGGVLIRKEKRPVIKYKNIKTRMPYVFTYKDGRKVYKQHWIDHPNLGVIRMVFRDITYPLKGLGITPSPKTETAKSTEGKRFYRTDKDTLPYLSTTGRLQKTIIKLLLKKSSIDRVISTFQGSQGKGLISKIGSDGCLHTNYNQCVTATGRLSSSDPNSQNLPRSGTSPIKQCIIPRYDLIMNADLSQIEWRIPAQLSGDAVMQKEIRNGMDCHSENCKNIMLLPLNKLNRYHTKIFNFRMIFRGTGWGFNKDPKMPRFGLKKWDVIVKAFWKKYWGLNSWHQRIIKHVIDGDGTLDSFTGRKWKFKLAYNGKYNESQISNSPVQGFAGGDLLPLAAVIIWDAMKQRKFKSDPGLTVHDSLVFDVYKGEQDALADLCMDVFTNLPKYIKSYWGYDWQVPITGEIEIGDNYGDQVRIR